MSERTDAFGILAEWEQCDCCGELIEPIESDFYGGSGLEWPNMCCDRELIENLAILDSWKDHHSKLEAVEVRRILMERRRRRMAS